MLGQPLRPDRSPFVSAPETKLRSRPLDGWLASHRFGEGWCQERESNPRPKAYESSALPLSYPGGKRDGNKPSAAAEIQPNLACPLSPGCISGFEFSLCTSSLRHPYFFLTSSLSRLETIRGEDPSPRIARISRMGPESSPRNTRKGRKPSSLVPLLGGLCVSK